MATKPTVRIPLWASGGTTTDPGGGKEAAGWLPDERPPANWWNWVWNAMGQWLGWAETSIDEIAARPAILYAAHLEFGTTPQVVWEKGDTASIVANGNAVTLNMGGTYSVTNYCLQILKHTIASTMPEIEIRASSSGASSFIIQAWESTTGTAVNLNALYGGVDPRFFFMVVGP